MTAVEVLPVVNAKLKDVAISESQRLLALDEIKRVILNFCNIDIVPDALEYTWANMTVDLLRYEQAANTPIDATDENGNAKAGGIVSSIHEGDTTVSFGGKSAEEIERDRTLDTHKAKLDDLIMGYKNQLYKYRRVRW